MSEDYWKHAVTCWCNASERLQQETGLWELLQHYCVLRW